MPVVVHILTPGFKLVQVTQDLGGFWREHYPKLKLELQWRYPKHEWRQVKKNSSHGPHNTKKTEPADYIVASSGSIHTGLPATIVAVALPFRVQPKNGLLSDLLAEPAAL